MALKFATNTRKPLPKFSIGFLLLSFALTWLAQSHPEWQLFARFAILPEAFFTGERLNLHQWYRLLTAIFLHANWFHWAGNMVIFLPLGIHLERHTNSRWFAFVFLFSGLVGNGVSLVLLRDSGHYLLGASGAISGLLGAWLRLFPQKRLHVLIPIGLYLQKARVPISIFILVWLVTQFALQLNSQSYHIAWSAHIAGFITGFVLASAVRP